MLATGRDTDDAGARSGVRTGAVTGGVADTGGCSGLGTAVGGTGVCAGVDGDAFVDPGALTTGAGAGVGFVASGAGDGVAPIGVEATGAGSVTGSGGLSGLDVVVAETSVAAGADDGTFVETGALTTGAGVELGLVASGVGKGVTSFGTGAIVAGEDVDAVVATLRVTRVTTQSIGPSRTVLMGSGRYVHILTVSQRWRSDCEVRSIRRHQCIPVITLSMHISA